MSSALGRADLLMLAQALGLGVEQLDEYAYLFGFDPIPKLRKPSSSPQESGGTVAGSTQVVEVSDVPQLPWAPIPFFKAEEIEFDDRSSDEVESRETPVDTFTFEDSEAASLDFPKAPPIASWSELWPRIYAACSVEHTSRRIDETKLVSLVSRYRPIARVPRRSHRTWPEHLRILVDRAPHLVPIYDDQDAVVAELKSMLGARVLTEECGTRAEVTLALSDVGERAGGGLVRQWWDAKETQVSGEESRPVALSPRGRGAVASRSRWSSIPWQASGGLRAVAQTKEAQRLLTVLVGASRIEASLLRAARYLFPTMDLETECVAWSMISSGGAEVVGWPAELASRLRADYARDQDGPQKVAAVELIRDWHQYALGEVWQEESAYLTQFLAGAQAPFAQKILDMLDMKATGSLPERALATLQRGSPRAQQVILRWVRGLVARAPDALLRKDGEIQDSEDRFATYFELHRIAHQRGALADAPRGASPEDLKDRADGKLKTWRILDERGRLALRSADSSETALLSLPAKGKEMYAETQGRLNLGLALELGTPFGWSPEDVGQTKPEPLPQYSWAHKVTEDKYGVLAEVRIKDVSFILRWIESGTFAMGSPDSEEGRYDDEGPQHEVKLSGYWMAETPVTQALYETVTGENPSKFVSNDRPVEQVSWDQCTKFCTQLNALIPGLNLRLPTEAQWEYAGRAGTKTSTYAGQLELLGANNAPLLDDVAWYGGNSGVGFDLDNGTDNSDWDDKQYEEGPAGTHPVKGKAPNPWGLYDTLGNVWEWCSDYWGKYSESPSANPLGPTKGAYRVVRGGSGRDHAQYVRAAYRSGSHPSSAHSHLGFRVSRGQARPEASPNSGAERAARRASESGITLITDRAKARIEVCAKPDWASAIGRDRYGLWTAVDVAPKVQMRLRWIPPGRFTMGSPKTEAGHLSWEVQHEVTLTQGYWLGETPVTQAVWQAVMGTNPSEFVSEQRPVESVSWEGCVAMLEQWNGQQPGLNLGLPTEAQWEYACRAGTTTSTYAGDLEILGERNPPVLDGIAWYGGNSWVGFDLDDGRDNSDWDEKQYEDGPAGTHPVKGKAANPWGLYDTLGNVYEWCSDWHNDYSKLPSTNPLGPSVGTDRVVRGGSWDDHAQDVRAARRGGFRPSDADSDLGFRVSRGQAGR